MRELNCCECAYLEKQGVGIVDGGVAASIDAAEDQQLVKKTSGICLTGQRGECPLGYNCGEIILLDAIPPLYILIEPKEVKK